MGAEGEEREEKEETAKLRTPDSTLDKRVQVPNTVRNDRYPLRIQLQLIGYIILYSLTMNIA